MTTDSPLRSRLRSALLDARRARDSQTVSAIRNALSALENAEAVPAEHVRAGAVEQAARGVGAADGARRHLTDAEERAVLDTEIAALAEAAEAYAGTSPERVGAALAGVAVLSSLR